MAQHQVVGGEQQRAEVGDRAGASVQAGSGGVPGDLLEGTRRAREAYGKAKTAQRPLGRPSECVNELGARGGRSLSEESHGPVPRGHPDICAVGAAK